ncbi:MAG: MOSC domain-containing protein, partial [Rhizobiales bacterium]|nr:MOSC domain-containing protein [Hyphomicrobiales bacterium]
ASGFLSISDVDGNQHKFDLNSAADQEKLGALVEAYGGAAQPGPYTLAKVPGRHLTDRDKNWVSINCTASHDKVEADTGMKLSHRRWRGNIWIENTQPFEEFSWIGKTIAIGETRLRVDEPIERCAATSANTDTGERDINMLQHLYSTYNHRNFGVFAEVIQGGHIRSGDSIEILEA